jgi:hypothetical protein
MGYVRTPLLFAVALLTMSAADCQKPVDQSPYAGIWVMHVGGRVFSVLEIQEHNTTYSAKWTYPDAWTVGAGQGGRFSKISNKTKSTDAQAVTAQGSHLRIIMPDPTSPAEPDQYDMTLAGIESASIQLADAPIAPWPFFRVSVDQRPNVASDWAPLVSYALGDDAISSNPEMAAIYAEDQTDERNLIGKPQSAWEAAQKNYADRRQRVRTLLDADALQIGEDFEKAAFIFQHGNQPNHYLLAHALALAALAKGDTDASQIAALTLDRYLSSIDHRQIFGPDHDAFGPKRNTFDPSVVPPSLRKALGLPSEQELMGLLKQVQADSSQPAK